MEEAISIALSGLAGLLAGMGWVKWRTPKTGTTVLHEAEPLPLFHGLRGHEWHIKGKVNGRVRMWCSTPGCKSERWKDGPE